MEVSTLKTVGMPGMRGPSPFLRLQTDERLVALTRRGNQAAYEVLVGRYHARLIAFTRHMLGSKEDAEDIVQETFAAAYSAMCADERALNLRPWLYRIARNRSLNHLRRHQAIGVDSFEHHVADHGTTTADSVHQREEFRLLIADVQELPETQRTALLLREIDALSYDQIAEAMETTVPSVKSLLVRARVGLAEAAEARNISCDDVRAELGEVAEGLMRITPAVRRHARECERCGAFKKSLRDTNRTLAMVMPVGPLLMLKKLLLAQFGTTASAGGGAATAAVSTAATSSAGSSLAAGMGALASKAVATVAAAAVVTAGAVEVKQSSQPAPVRQTAHIVAQASTGAQARVAAPPVATRPLKHVREPLAEPAAKVHADRTRTPKHARAVAAPPAPTTSVTPDVQPTVAAPAPQEVVDVVQVPQTETSDVTLPAQTGGAAPTITPPSTSVVPSDQGTTTTPTITNPEPPAGSATTPAPLP